MKKIFNMAIAAVIVLFASCASDDDMATLSGLNVSQSFVTIPVAGGNATIEVDAVSEWIMSGYQKAESWLDISNKAGNSGKTEIKFSAAATLDGRSVELKILSADEVQYVKVMQGLPVISTATCAEIIAGPDGKKYQVTGIVQNISNTTYGNWDLVDKTGKVYIYGTLDAKGNTQNFKSLGLEEGDEVTVTGPKKTYGSTVELVDVEVVKINKSLIKVESVDNSEFPLEGGEVEVTLTTKGDGVSIDIPQEAKEWLSIASIRQEGTTAYVKLKAAANLGGDRSVTIVFRTLKDGKEYTSNAVLTQKGAIIAATVAEFWLLQVGDTQYRLSGVVTEIKNTKYGNYYIRDFSGDIYIYGSVNFADYIDLKPGDIVTVVGKRGEYNGDAQMVNGTIEEVKYVKEATVAEFLAAAEDPAQYYLLTGAISNIASTIYGNFDLVDDSGSVYVYGLLTGWKGASKQFASLNLAEGDKISILGTRSAYNGTPQVGGTAVFFSKVTE